LIEPSLVAREIATLLRSGGDFDLRAQEFQREVRVGRGTYCVVIEAVLHCPHGMVGQE